MVKLVSRVAAALIILSLLVGALPSVGSAASVRWDKVDPALRTLMLRQPKGSWGIIAEGSVARFSGRGANVADRVLTAADRTKQAVDRLAANGLKPQARLSIVGGASATASYNAIAALSRDPSVSFIHYNAPMRRLEAIPAVNVYEEVVRAPEVWDLGFTGAGVGVAVLDSGVADNADLSQPINRVVARADFVADGSTSADPGGHGTHVAGIIAGNGYAAPETQKSAFKGIAPGANIIDVRVISEQGGTSLANVIAGVQWVVQNRARYNIRVMNLSLGAVTQPGYTYRTDPLVAALDVAWLAGITVIAAAGNTGPNAGTIETPGTSPMLITVGALDDSATTGRPDDTMPSWSSHGPTPDGQSKPDLVAPGRRIISLYEPNSTLSELVPDRMTPVGSAIYFRLSGTSMAAPVVAGTAALLLEKNPSLRPDQIKQILTRSTRPVTGYDANTVGSGVVDAFAAINNRRTDAANRGKRPADAFARAILPLIKGQPLQWRDLNYAGRTWSGITWDNIVWDGITWDNLLWDGILWDGILWDNLLWDGITWDITWSSINQDSVGGLSTLID